MHEPSHFKQIQEQGLHFASKIDPLLKLSKNVDYLWQESHPYPVRHRKCYPMECRVLNNQIWRESKYPNSPVRKKSTPLLFLPLYIDSSINSRLIDRLFVTLQWLFRI